MNADLKKLWVQALRSGAYKQGRHALEKEGRFCCLGVLCHTTGIAERAVADDFIVTYDHMEGSLSASAQDKAGLTIDACRSLMQWNDDDELTFAQIADYIEEERWTMK